MKVTCELMAKRWSDPNSRPLLKGELIDDDGCCCAQGDVLRVCGMTDDEIREMDQTEADRKVAKELGISRTHAVLLRNQNDKGDGCPQDVLIAPEKVLGPHANLVLAFWLHLDGLSAVARAEARYAAWDVARDAAWAAARDVARAAAWDAEWAAAWDAEWDVATRATMELQGASKLKTKPHFLKFFGIDDAEAWCRKVDPNVVLGWES